MREHKYKLWDKENKEWDNSGNIYLDETGQLYEMYEAGGYSQYMYRKNVTERYEIVFFTGLNDKNDKEIYEGDIVDLDGFDSHGDFGEYKLEFKGIFKVEWRDDLAGFDLCKVGANVDGWCLTEDSRHDLTVIGNIYENVDLLSLAQSAIEPTE